MEKRVGVVANWGLQCALSRERSAQVAGICSPSHIHVDDAAEEVDGMKWGGKSKSQRGGTVMHAAKPLASLQHVGSGRLDEKVVTGVRACRKTRSLCRGRRKRAPRSRYDCTGHDASKAVRPGERARRDASVSQSTVCGDSFTCCVRVPASGCDAKRRRASHDALCEQIAQNVGCGVFDFVWGSGHLVGLQRFYRRSWPKPVRCLALAGQQPSADFCEPHRTSPSPSRLSR